MDLKRFFTDTPVVGQAILTDAEYIHAVKVTRHKVGFRLIVCDNSGYDYHCTITEITKDALYAQVDEKVANKTESKHKISLYIGINKDLDTVVQKAVEMGCSAIIPFFSQHTNIDSLSMERLNKIVLESSKQTGRAILSKIQEPMSLKTALSVAKDTNIVFFYEYAEDNKVSDFIFKEGDISIFIGSEGGFSTEEVALFQDHGVSPLTLGKRILRVSTAVVASLALTESALGEL